MEDSFSGDEDYYYSDRDSLDGLENDEADLQWVPPKGSSTKVHSLFSKLGFFAQFVFLNFELLFRFVWVILSIDSV